MNYNYLSPSLKDYLRVIYCIQSKGDIVRVTDIAVALQVSKPSVCRAVSQLEVYGLVTHECHQPLYLTNRGLQTGKQLLENFRTIQHLLIDTLGVDEKTACYDAWKISCILSNATIERLKIFNNTDFLNTQLYAMAASL